MKLALFILTFPLCATTWPRLSDGRLRSSITVTNQSGSAQTGVVVTGSYFFAPGEIGGYPKPLVGSTFANGVTPATWQADVKTRHRDKLVSCSITGATKANQVVVTCASHGFMYGDRVVITGASGMTELNGTWTVENGTTTNTFPIIANGTSWGTWTSGGTARGPAYGSVQHALVSFPVDFAASNTVLSVTFADSAVRCNLSSDAACDSAGLTGAQMLAFNGGTWTATSSATASSIEKTASARTMLTDGNFAYWRRGPVVTEVVAQDLTSARVYDFGWSCSLGCGQAVPAAAINTTTDTITVTGHGLSNGTAIAWLDSYAPGGITVGTTYYVVNATTDTFQVSATLGGAVRDLTTQGADNHIGIVDYSNTTWSSDTTNKPMHPAFRLLFAGAGVGAQCILENVWNLKAIDQYYSLSCSTSGGAFSPQTGGSFPMTVTHYWASRLRFPLDRWAWDGTAIPAYSLDLNTPYLSYAGALPNFDTTKIPSAGTISSTATALDGKTWTPYSTGSLTYKAFSSTGGRQEIGPITGNAAIWIQGSWSYSMLSGMTKEATMGGWIVDWGNWRDTDWARWYDANQTAYAGGRFWNPSARTTTRGGVTSGNGPWDAVKLSPLSSAHGWQPDLAHSPNVAYPAYLYSGDPFLLDNLQAQAAYALGQGNPCTSYNGSSIVGYAWQCRDAAAGVMSESQQNRGIVWGTRNLALAALMTPDGTLEKAVLYGQVMHNIAKRAGAINLKQSRFYNGAEWVQGNYMYRDYVTNPFPQNELPMMSFYEAGVDSPDANETPGDPYQCRSAAQGHPWMNHYWLATLGWLRNMGWPTGELLERGGKLPIEMVLSPDYNPYLLTGYGFCGRIGQETDLPPDSYEHPNGRHPQTVKDLFLSRSTTQQQLTNWRTGSETDCGDGYYHIAKAALQVIGPISVGPYKWADALAFVLANGTTDCSNNPKWQFVAKFDSIRYRVEVGDTQAVVHYIAPRADEACTWDGSSDGITNGRERTKVFTGLTAATPYSYALASASAAGGTVTVAFTTTESAGGSAPLSMTLAPPATIGGTVVATVAVDYGTTSAVSDGTVTAVRADSVTLSIPANSGRSLWTRVRYLDSGSSSLAVGQSYGRIR